MSRTSRVPYHQNVYDLLQIEPRESPEAVRLIAEHEAKCGPLPGAVSEWFLSAFAATAHTTELESSIESVLRSFAINDGLPGVLIRDDNYGKRRVVFDGSEDPRVSLSVPDGEPWDDWTTWVSYPARELFTEFVLRVVALHREPNQPNCSFEGHWLRTSDEPFQPPVIDFLTDQFGEPERTPRPGHVTTYTFRPPGGTLRVTADEPSLTGGLSAWWVHAETPERLAEFAALVVPWGTLRDALRADTEAARGVLTRVRG